MKDIRLMAVFLALSCASPPCVAAAESESLSALQAGEIVLLESSADRSGAAIRAQMLARGQARSIWEVIVSCPKAFAFVDGLQTCEVLEDSGDRALVHQVVKKGWPVPIQDFVFESLRQPYREMRFSLVEGNLKAMQGRWTFNQGSEGLLVDYEFSLQPAFPAPKFLVRRNIRKDMPDMLACIRGLASASLSRAGREDDLARCPGNTPADAAQ
jgi:hypothetical protein